MDRLKTEFVDLADARIAYCEHGAGKPLILLHGNSESKHIFKQYQLDHFNMYRTIAVDSRGHGESQSNDAVYTIEKFSEDVINLCKAKGIKEAYVIGYSDGGNIALFLAKKAPTLFSRIVAISPNTLVSGTTDGALKTFQTMLKMMNFLDRLGFNMKKSIMRFDLMMKDIGLTDEDLKGIQTQMKIIYAEKDLIKEDHIRQIATLIPNASLDKILDCTHMTVFKKKEAIALMQRYFSG